MKTIILFLCVAVAANAQSWEPLAQGIYYKEVIPSIESTKTKTYPVFYLKIERGAEWHLLTEHLTEQRKNAFTWSYDHNLNIVTNMGMFTDKDRPTGYTRINNNVITSARASGYNGALVGYYGATEAGVVDSPTMSLENDFYEYSKGYRYQHKYETHLIRMVADGKVVWSKQPKYWSTACIGMDNEGAMYLIFSRSGYMVNTLAHEILSVIPEMKNVYYLEGGPEASLYVGIGDFEYKGIGSYETGFNENDDNIYFWNLPNIIGLSVK